MAALDEQNVLHFQARQKNLHKLGVNMHVIFHEIKEENSSSLSYCRCSVTEDISSVLSFFFFFLILLTFDVLMQLYLLSTEACCLLLMVFPFSRGFQEQQCREIAFPKNETECGAVHNWVDKSSAEDGVGYITFHVQALIDSLYKIQ